MITLALNSQATCLFKCAIATDCGPSGFQCQNGFCCGKQYFRCCHGGTACATGTCAADDYCR